MTALLGLLHRPAGQRGSADLRLRVGPQYAVSCGAIEFAIGFKATNRRRVRVLPAERLGIKFAKLVAARVLRAGLEPAGVHLVPHFPEWHAPAAFDAATGR